MVRVLRYPRMCMAACASAIVCALARDICVGRALQGWANVLLLATLLLLGACFVLMSCRFFVDVEGVGVGFLLRVRRTSWEDMAALGVLYCNSSRPYLYGLYHGSADFLQMLHHAPSCGPWGFVAPLNRKLIRAVVTYCPYSVDLSHMKPRGHDDGLRPLWHQAALYLGLMLPAAAVAFATAAAMIVRAAGRADAASCLGLALGALALMIAGALLMRRAMIAALTCPGISEEGVCAGRGMYLSWQEIQFGYVHRTAQGSGLFLISQPIDTANHRKSPPVKCLSLPDTSTLVLAYLTYCPNAKRNIDM